MLELVVSAEVYKASSKGQGLIQTSSLPANKGNIDSIGIAVSPLGIRASASTHFFMREVDFSSFNADQLALTLSRDSYGVACRELKGRYHELDVFFHVKQPEIDFCDNDCFHNKTGRYCIEFGATFKSKNYSEFTANFSDYRTIAYSIFSMLYGSGRMPRVHLRLESTPSNNPLFRELSDIATNRQKQGQEKSEKEKREQPTPPSQYEIGNPDVNWRDIGGLYRQKEELLLVIDRFLHPEQLAFFGKSPAEQGGYLLVGPTGCGKGLLAKAVATQLRQELGDKLKIYFPSYAHLTSMWRGQEGKEVQALFKAVKEEIGDGNKVMVFLDEFQSFSQRHYTSTNPEEGLEQFLLELDRLDTTNALFLAGSAQPLGTFDPQMIRPGRFGSIIEVTIPDPDESREVLKATTRKMRRRAIGGNNPYLFEEGGLDYESIVAETQGFPSAHLVGLIEDAIKGKEIVYMHSRRFKPITTDYILRGVQRRRDIIARSAKRYAHLISADHL